MAHIEWELTKGQWALIDIDDWSKIEKYKWHAAWDDHTKSYYAITETHNRTLRMHRLIVGLDFGDERKTDHKNHNTLDNRRENLKIVTTKQNNRNRRNAKGFRPLGSKYQARICVDYKILHLGCFNTPEEARKAYEDAKEKYWR